MAAVEQKSEDEDETKQEVRGREHNTKDTCKNK